MIIIDELAPAPTAEQLDALLSMKLHVCAAVISPPPHPDPYRRYLAEFGMRSPSSLPLFNPA